MITHLAVLSLLTVLLPLSPHFAFAETTDIPTPPLAPPITSPGATEAFVTDAMLSDDDLTADLAAEALPTTNQFSYRWELFQNGFLRFFTLKATQKALLYEQHLHTLDRKLAACAEIGDEKCAQLVEERMDKLTDRASAYMERRQELKDKLLGQFQDWRADREALITQRQELITELKDRRQELIAERKEARGDARANRADRREEMKNNAQERREFIQQNIEQGQQNRQQLREEVREQQQLNVEQRQQNREQLIEMRSRNVADQLEATEEQIQQRQADLLISD